MGREKDLIKNTLILAVGSFLPKAMAFITLPILTANLSRYEFGIYDLITTTILLAIPVVTLQIQSAAFRFLVDTRGNQGESSIIVTNIYSVVVPMGIVSGLIILMVFPYVDFGVRVYVSLYLVFDSLVISSGQICRGLGYNKSFSIGAIISSLASTVGIFILVYLCKQGLKGLMFSLIVGQLLSLLYLSCKVGMIKYIDIKLLSLDMTKEMLSYSWPMVPNNLSVWALNLSDRLVVTFFMGVEENAVYAVANKIPSILSIAQSVMVMAWHENASLAIKDKDPSSYYSKMLEKIYDLVLGGTGIIIAFTPLLFKILIKGEYEEAYYQMPVLILAMFFCVMSSFFGGIYIAHKRTVNVGISTIIAAAVNLIVDICLIKVIGLWAASISTIIAYALLYYYRMINVQHFQKVHINIAKELFEVLLIVGMLFLCFQRRFIFNVINGMLAVAVFTIFNKESILLFAGMIKERIKKYGTE